MYTSDGQTLRSLENQIGEQQKLSWAMLLFGLAGGFIGMYFIVARPMSQELRAMKVEMAQVQGQMEQLSAQGEQVWEANSLLSLLKVQEDQLKNARSALQSVEQLQADVVKATEQARLCLSQMNAVTKLHDRIILEQPSVEIAGRVLDDMSQVNERLAAGKQRTQAATEVLDRIIDLEDDLTAQTVQIDEAQTVARKMISLQEDLRQEKAGIDAAWFSLHGLVILKNSLMNGAQYVEVAQAIGDQLLAMQQQLAERGTTSEIAMNRAQQLLELNATLSRNDLDLQTSRATLEAMIQMQQRIRDLPSISQSMDSLDLLIAFQDEFIDQMQSLGEMRNSLIEIALMETTLAKAVRTLQPLLELGNVRRMSDEEIRSAARSILEERNTRLSNRTSRSRQAYESNAVKDAAVPQPTEEK